MDDFLIAGESDETLSQIYQQLSEQLKLRNLGFPKRFLGIEFTRHGDQISLHQAEYVKKILAKFCMEDSKEKATPMATNIQLNADTAGEYLDEPSAARY